MNSNFTQDEFIELVSGAKNQQEMDVLINDIMPGCRFSLHARQQINREVLKWQEKQYIMDSILHKMCHETGLNIDDLKKALHHLPPQNSVEAQALLAIYHNCGAFPSKDFYLTLRKHIKKVFKG